MGRLASWTRLGLPLFPDNPIRRRWFVVVVIVFVTAFPGLLAGKAPPGLLASTAATAAPAAHLQAVFRTLSCVQRSPKCRTKRTYSIEVETNTANVFTAWLTSFNWRESTRKCVLLQVNPVRRTNWLASLLAGWRAGGRALPQAHAQAASASSKRKQQAQAASARVERMRISRENERKRRISKVFWELNGFQNINIVYKMPLILLTTIGNFRYFWSWERWGGLQE
jgi:signal transduction histidine kinase